MIINKYVYILKSIKGLPNSKPLTRTQIYSRRLIFQLEIMEDCAPNPL